MSNFNTKWNSYRDAQHGRSGKSSQNLTDSLKIYIMKQFKLKEENEIYSGGDN